MKHKIAGFVDSLISILLFVIVGVTPLLFASQTTEFFEMPKLAFLIVSTLGVLGLWIFSWILKGKVTITRTPLDIPLLLLLATIVVSTFFSATRVSAIYGNFPKVHGSAVSWVAYILLYFVAVSNLKSVNAIKTFLYVLLGSAVIVVLTTLMSFFGMFLPFDFAHVVNFTPTGSSFSTIALLLLLLPIPLLSIINPNKYLPAPAAVVLASLFGITIVLIGSMPTYALLLITFVLCFIISKRERALKALPLFVIPVAAALITLVLAYVPVGSANPIQNLELNFPKEVQLPLSSSWKISVSAFRDTPFIGTGPSSYLFNFTTYKPAEFNSLKFWNFSFDSAYNEILQVMGTLGILGLISLLAICFVVLLNAWKNLTVSDADEHDMHLVSALAVSGIVTVMLLLVHAATLVSIVVSFLVLAALMASQRSIREKVMNLSMGMKASTANNELDLFPIILFVAFLIGGAYILLQEFNTVSADFYHRQGLLQANKNGTLTYQYLQKAESLNPLIDLYRVDMAQTNFALANALVIKKGPSKTNPKGSLTDQDKKTIQTLLSQAISEGRVAVALSPRSSRNWEVLASIYRNITGVAQNALAFALDAYGQAIQRDPVNPALRLNVGGIYYAAKNYNMAIRFFTDAANLKPDYANAYFNLAIALRDNGDLQNALLVAQRAVALLEAQSGTKTSDYKIATALVTDLKARAAQAAKSQTGGKTTNAQAQAPASQTNSALQNQNIGNVQVNNLNNPPQATPQPAVKPNPSTKLPQTNSQLSPAPAK